MGRWKDSRSRWALLFLAVLVALAAALSSCAGAGGPHASTSPADGHPTSTTTRAAQTTTRPPSKTSTSTSAPATVVPTRRKKKTSVRGSKQPATVATVVPTPAPSPAGPTATTAPVTTITTAPVSTPPPTPPPTTTPTEPATTTTAPPPCAIADRMPDFIGYPLSRVDASLAGNPATTPGVDRHYVIVPPPGSIGPASVNDRVVAQSPDAGYCSTTSLGSTLDLALP